MVFRLDGQFSVRLRSNLGGSISITVGCFIIWLLCVAEVYGAPIWRGEQWISFPWMLFLLMNLLALIGSFFKSWWATFVFAFVIPWIPPAFQTAAWGGPPHAYLILVGAHRRLCNDMVLYAFVGLSCYMVLNSALMHLNEKRLTVKAGQFNVSI